MLDIKNLTYRDVAKTIDHSLLRPELTHAEVEEGCLLAKKYDVASVCVKPSDVVRAVSILKGSDVAVGTVIGFPHGAHTTATKVFEAQDALTNGATELDMVLNIGALRSGQADFVRDDIAAVVASAKGKAIVKVILEMAYLTHDEKVLGCQLVEQAGGHFVKTSTGFAPSGATVEDIRLMRATVSPHVQVKAAGGVRTLEALLTMLEAGATRAGATATAPILDAFTSGAALDPAAAAPSVGY
jgi:deoxyribose-phosphate aldolase